jgi:hypothetical protein
MSECGKRVAAEYDWDIIVRRVLEYYAQLIAARQTQDVRAVRVRRQLYWRRLRRSLRAMGL